MRPLNMPYALWIHRTAGTWFLLSLLLALLPSLKAQGLFAKSSTTAQLSLDVSQAQPGDRITAAIHLKSIDGWHTYWRNPGDDGGGGPIGQATRIDWTLPQGVTAGPIQWPTPEKYVEKEFHTHILNEGTLLVPLTLAPNLSFGTFNISAKLRWLECKEECVPGSATVNASLSVGPEAKPSPANPAIQAAAALLPSSQPTTARGFWETSSESERRSLIIEWEHPVAQNGFDFFPFEKQGDFGAKSVALPPANSKSRLRKLVGKPEAGWPSSVRGVLAPTTSGKPTAPGFEVNLSISEPASNATAAANTNAVQEPVAIGTLLVMLSFAFIGGLILNIMPCVLPVLALKILGFVNQAKQDPKLVRSLGLIYGLGVIVSFIALASIALLVQKAGGVAGWSTAFQNPYFRIGLTVLITLVALNLFGLFEVTLHPTATETAFVYASKEGPVGAFFNGILAAALATPCTAPFLGAAIGFAFTQPALILLLFFVTAGAGLALPFVVLCWNPAWLKLIPRPGHWMVRFKVAMGFPMLATAIWLFWFTATRMGDAGVLWFGLSLVTIAAATWVWGEFVQRGASRRGLAIATSLGLVAISLVYLLPKASQRSKIDWKKWSPEAVARAQAEGHPVLVDFTADTCLNCKFNKSTSIEIASTIRILGEIKAVTLEGDFTDADPEIAKELAKHGRRGVPLVLVYSKVPGSEPKVLPTVLTPTIVHEALDWASKP